MTCWLSKVPHNVGRLDPDTPPVTYKRSNAQVVRNQSLYRVYDLNIFSFTVSIIVRILQSQWLKIHPDLTNIVIDGGYEETADGGEGPGAGADEICPVLLRSGVTSLSEATADSESLGAASISFSTLWRTLVGGITGTWNQNNLCLIGKRFFPGKC